MAGKSESALQLAEATKLTNSKANVRNASLATIERVLAGISKVVVAILVTRTLGAEGQGIFALMVGVWSVVAVWSVMGIEVANNFFGARLLEAKERGALLGNTVFFCTVAGILGGGIVWVAFRWTELLNALPPELTAVVIGGTVLMAFVVPVGNLLYGFEAFGNHLVGTLVQTLVFMIGALVFALTGNLNSWWLGVLWLISVALSVLYWLYGCMQRSQFRIGFDRSLLGQQLRYGLNGYLYNAFNVVNFRLDVILLAQFAAADIVGLYAISVAVTEMVLFIPKGITNVVLTRVSREGGVGEGAFRVLAAFVFVVVLCAGFVAPFIVPRIFGDVFVGSIMPLLILLPGTYMLSLGVVGSFALFGVEKGRYAAGAALVGACVTVGFNIVLIPPLGIVGAAIASSVAYSVFGGIVFYLLTDSIGVAIRYVSPDFRGAISVGRSLILS